MGEGLSEGEREGREWVGSPSFDALWFCVRADHVRFAHATTIWPFFLDNVGVFDQFGRHMRNLFPKRTIKSLADQPRATWSLRPHCNIL